jgi:hypothetical protein
MMGFQVTVLNPRRHLSATMLVRRCLWLTYLFKLTHKQVQDCVAQVQELRAIDRDVVGINRIFDYENFDAFINDDGNDLICAADV